MDNLNNLKTCKYTHNAATVPGDVIVVNCCVLVAVNTALANAENVYVYSGKVTIPKNNALVINALDQVYWDAGRFECQQNRRRQYSLRFLPGGGR